MNLRYVCELLFLAALWGGSFIFIRIGSPEFGPFALMMMRCLIAGLVLLPIMLMSKKRLQLIQHSGAIVVVGVLGTAIPFVMYGYAALALTAGVISVLNATTAMFTAIIAFFWLKESLTRVSVCGLLVGFMGVVFLAFDKTEGGNASLLATLAALTASVCYAATANFTKLYLGGVSSLITSGGSQLVAALVLAPLGVIYWPEVQPSAKASWSVVILGVFCTALALTFFFRLIEVLGPAKAVSVAYLIPMFGLLWGVVFLAEEITVNIFVGGLMVLLGVALTTGLFDRYLNVKHR